LAGKRVVGMATDRLFEIDDESIVLQAVKVIESGARGGVAGAKHPGARRGIGGNGGGTLLGISSQCMVYQQQHNCLANKRIQ